MDVQNFLTGKLSAEEMAVKVQEAKEAAKVDMPPIFVDEMGWFAQQGGRVCGMLALANAVKYYCPAKTDSQVLQMVDDACEKYQILNNGSSQQKLYAAAWDMGLRIEPGPSMMEYLIERLKAKEVVAVDAKFIGRPYWHASLAVDYRERGVGAVADRDNNSIEERYEILCTNIAEQSRWLKWEDLLLERNPYDNHVCESFHRIRRR